MKKTLLGFCFSSLIFLSSSAFAQTSTETWSSEGLGTLGGENIKTAAEIKKLLIGTWVLNDDPKQTVTFTATTVTFRVKGLSQKPSTYKMEDECVCDFTEVPPSPNMVGCFMTNNPKVCFLVDELSKASLNLMPISPVGEYYHLKKKK